MSYIASGDTIDRLTYLVVAERPEWDEWVVRSVLHSHKMQVDGTDLAIASMRAAKNRNYLTPKAIGWRGPHWDGLDTKPVEAQHRDRCGVCGRYEPQCAAIRPGGDDHLFEPVPDLKRGRR